jgi:hypothetical protein
MHLSMDQRVQRQGPNPIQSQTVLSECTSGSYTRRPAEDHKATLEMLLDEVGISKEKGNHTLRRWVISDRTSNLGRASKID